MKFKFKICLLVFYLCFNTAFSQLKITELKTEYQINPIGIDVKSPRLSWKISSTERNILQTAYEVKVASTEKDLKSSKNLLWNTKKISSSQSVNIEYKGDSLHSSMRVYWQARVYDNKNNISKWSEPAFWEMGLLKPNDWKASWIEPNIKEDTTKSLPCNMLRKNFNLSKQIKQARLYVSSHGLYQIELNGGKITDHLFTPGWTSYNKRLQYQVYDLSSQLKQGQNAIGVILGDGWYRGWLTWDKKRNFYGNKLALLLQIEVIYEDNTKEMIISDGSWKTSTGAILKSDIYNGETYDARLEKPKWSSFNYNDSDWNGVIVKNINKKNLVANVGDAVRRIQEIKAVKVFKASNGETIADLGQNMVGWIRIDVKGNAGTIINLKYAEVLDKKGNFYTENLRDAKAMDQYILKGGEQESFEPHFTFHGFRYVSLEGYPGLLKPENITGIVIHSDFKPSGSFRCSDSLVNQLQHNIVWGLKGNFLDVPTDCPQRDERLGWTGDAQAFAPTACFNMDVASFYTKWLKDMKADQLKTGAVPWVIPDILKRGGAAGWADAAVVIPWTMYLNYGDTRILAEQYESMQSWVNFMKKIAGDSCIWKKGHQFGDWLAYSTTNSDYPGATTDKDLIATAYFAYSTSLLHKTAVILGKQEDAVKYEELFNKIRKAYQDEFITTNGRLASNTQTAYVLSLAFGLLPPSIERTAAERLANDVRKFKHLTTGFLGTPLLCQILTKYGYTDLAFKLLFNKKYPSWLYPITMGASTIWERWDGIKPDSSFQDKGMNSFNHYAYGAIGKWLYSSVAGIETSEEAPGYKKIIIKPHTDSKLTFAEAEYISIYGKISSKWKIENKDFTLNLIIPANTTAEVCMPNEAKDEVYENANVVSKNKDIKFIESRQGYSVFQVGSGSYSFSTKMNKLK